jgi:type 1 glutamine amidotransferase
VRAAVARGEPQIVAWAFERPDGGRGFGFTGGHYHKNFGDGNFRKTVLNGLLWAAKMEVPANGVESAVSEDDLKANLDLKGRKQ